MLIQLSIIINYYDCSYGYRLLVEGHCADIVQPDITWMGGITEVRRVSPS